MESESSLPYSQVPATCPYPEPTPSSPHNPLPLPEDPSQYYPPNRDILKYQTAQKSVQWDSEFSRADEQTDMMKLTVAFHNFANAPKKDRNSSISRG